MCRQAYFPKKTNMKDPLVAELLEYLDDAQGGHGCGLGRWAGETAEITKGFKVTPAQLAKVAAEAEGDHGWLFHARLASSGPQIDYFNQPFHMGPYLMTHNGHWSDWKQAYWALAITKTISIRENFNDSRTIAALIKHLGPLVTWDLTSGVVVSWKKGETARVDVISGDWAYSSLPLPIGGYVYASSFPDDWPVTVMEFKSGSAVIMEPKGPKLISGDAPTRRLVSKWMNRGERKHWRKYANEMAKWQNSGEVE